MLRRSDLVAYHTLISGGILALALCSVALAQPGNIITFDAPGAGSGFRQGTTATGINAAGAITGYYVDWASFYHGFVRNRSGDFTEFDAGGAGTGTLAYGINDAGAVTGYYIDTYGLAHGFVRSPSGVVTTFDAPPASTSGTYAFSINDAGAITGFYIDGAVCYSFLRDASGTITTFGVPGAGGDGLNGTRANSINNSNSVAGSWSYNSSVYTVPNYGFVRTRLGFIETFSAPGAGSSPDQGTLPYGINDAGAVAGTYVDAHGMTRGFVRSPGGVFTTIVVPGGPKASAFPYSINDAGAITGAFSVPAGLSHGFVRSPSGVFTPFDVPGGGGAAYSGTFPGSISQAGAITGYFIDEHSTNHGFLRTP
jgi:hypothetical protein